MVGSVAGRDDGSMPPSRATLQGFWAVHQWLWRVTGHRIGTAKPARGRVGTLFLLSAGRRTGTIRRNGLYFLADGPDLVVVATNAGAGVEPQWWLNLQARPEAEVELGRRTIPVRARPATPDERARLWPRLVSGYPRFAAYQKMAPRDIPVVVLEPR